MEDRIEYILITFVVGIKVNEFLRERTGVKTLIDLGEGRMNWSKQETFQEEKVLLHNSDWNSPPPPSEKKYLGKPYPSQEFIGLPKC